MAIALTESAEPPAQIPDLSPEVSGRSPWALAGRRLWRNRIAMAALVLFLLIIAVSFAAPLYANDVAKVNPFANNLNGTTIVNGHKVPLMQRGGGILKLGETPIGPTWDISRYFLGADQQGRDVFARVLYGGRSSLEIGIGSAVICCVIATIIALIAGYFGGLVDAILSRLMDVIWAFPCLPAGDFDLDGPAHQLQRPVHRARAPGGDEPVAPDDHHLLHLPAVCLPADPRPRAVGV